MYNNNVCNFVYFIAHNVLLIPEERGTKRKLGEDDAILEAWTQEDEAEQIAHDLVWNSRCCNIGFVQGNGAAFFDLVESKRVAKQADKDKAAKKNSVTEERKKQTAAQPVRMPQGLKRAREPTSLPSLDIPSIIELV